MASVPSLSFSRSASKRKGADSAQPSEAPRSALVRYAQPRPTWGATIRPHLQIRGFQRVVLETLKSLNLLHICRLSVNGNRSYSAWGETRSIRIVGAILCLVVLAFAARSQTTNLILAAPNFRESGGILYNVDRSVLWTNFTGDCLAVSNGVTVIQTFSMEPIMQASTRTEWRSDAFGNGRDVIVPTTIRTGERKVPGRKIALLNFPPDRATTGATVAARAIRIGTTSIEGMPLELWDYGMPHIVPVARTH
jgi:hypothetical protein